MRIVISALHFAWEDIPSCLARAHEELGLDGVELSWHASLARPHCTADDFAALERLAAGAGLELSAHLWENLAELGAAEAAARLRQWIRRCPPTGVRTLILHGGAWPDRLQGIWRTREALLAVGEDALAAGVTLCLENHYAFDYRHCCELFSEPWEFQDTLAPSRPWLGFCFDTGHGHMTRNGEALINGLGPSLRYVHLADNHGVDDDHCGYRQGTVPWDAYFSALDAVGFRGPFCVEFPVREDLAPFRRCVRDLRERFGAA